MALKFGSETWTPAMMAGIAKRKLTWRDILEGRTTELCLVVLPVYTYSCRRERMAA